MQIPKPRAEGVSDFVRMLWTAPTTLVGRLFARINGCGPGERVGGTATNAYLYHLPRGKLRGLGAIAIGHAIVVEPEFIAARRPWVLAHELSHTRQHDWLGPTYLVVHGLFQAFSLVASTVRPIRGFPPQHAYNPLERSLLSVPFDVLVAPEL